MKRVLNLSMEPVILETSTNVLEHDFVVHHMRGTLGVVELCVLRICSYLHVFAVVSEAYLQPRVAICSY